MLFNPAWSTEIDSRHGYIRSIQRLQMSHAGGRQAWSGDSNWLLSNPEIESTLMQAILTLVFEHVVERAYAQALANSHGISRAFSLQAIWCYVTTSLHLGADNCQMPAQQLGGR